MFLSQKKHAHVFVQGYSYGSLIATLFPVLQDPQIKTSYILISYPLGPRSFLTLFRSSTYTKRLQDLVRSPISRSRILILYGDQDEFTSKDNYVGWASDLVKLRSKVMERTEPGLVEASSRSDGSELRPGLTVYCCPGASHFWRGRHGTWLLESIEKWLSNED